MHPQQALEIAPRDRLRRHSRPAPSGIPWGLASVLSLCLAACSDSAPDPTHEEPHPGASQSRATPADVPARADVPAKGEKEAAMESMDEDPAADQTSVPILEKTVQVGAAKIHYLEAGPRLGLPVVFMHGSRFQAQTWRELGTLQLVAERGLRAIAFDLPGGEGKSPAAEFSIEQLVAQFCAALALQRPVIVSPSMSGRLAIPAIARNPELFRAWVPIAPAGMQAYLEDLSELAIPTLIVWGEEDRVFPVEGARELASRLVRSESLILKGASHTCYLEQPETFHKRLLEFLSEIE